MARHNVSLPDELSEFMEDRGLSPSKLLQNTLTERKKQVEEK